MYEYIQGKITELTPASVVIDNQGIGYFIHISLNTYSALSGKEQAVVFIHPVIREDAHLMYGFFSKSERAIFRQLITVSGIGANTARMILSSLSPDEVRDAILSGNVGLLNQIKGIGAKTAQRLIVDLKDKVGKGDGSSEFLFMQNNTNRDEALSALVMLGFAKNTVDKVLDKLIKEKPSASVEELVKHALKAI
ncbi:MAG TPA: Holliday junction branch migration protein RuvA [Marinilabiliales bacterium]|jgi:Holliday junction DNA helicase RuvA|nr:MAG: Holliday junction DNA helicase RuvA [Bacteroidetes bacterium GWA2_40_14]OFX58886.1 MAG: Holliday junction DNA helicase RuvA [Bacteroidetes bacterium GWC2_40_13]OFX75582.1 MAG: Holliday junction DNA helicase RuvA [Bacteroidetes bacterium GWD2_40_43]OFX90700.1 MAG: Holliday junction DNA helicase RuvA [Bacteroidetes bacterium GWE2_40_63]OFY20822.1 MAG: Holliday junction DNA helicase RuvA [Bacteroidetes bacterium GWF2_40_13]OFZ23758.1 MAG: Holliday junction DNA helicase RuvA [Bacteroidetes